MLGATISPQCILETLMWDKPQLALLRPHICDVAAIRSVVRLDLGFARFVCIIALRKCDGPDDLDMNTCTVLAPALLARFCLYDIFSSMKVPGVVTRVHGALRPVAPVPSRQCAVSRTMLALARFSRPHPIRSPIQQRTRKQTWLCTPMWLCDPSCGTLCLVVPTVRVRADLCRLVPSRAAPRRSQMVKDVPSNTTIAADPRRSREGPGDAPVVKHPACAVSLRGAATWRRCVEPLHVLVPLLSCTLPRSLH